MSELDELLARALRELAADAPSLRPLPARARRRIRAGRASRMAAVTLGAVAAAGMSGGLVIGAQARSQPSTGLAPARPAIVYVANDVSGTVTAIQVATGTAGTPVKVGRYPQAIAVTPDGKTVYVANVGSATVTPIRTATMTALTPIKVGNDPSALAITPDGATLYVTNTASNTVTAIRTATDTVVKTINVGRNPAFIAVTPDGKTAYVANDSADTVTPIRVATNTALRPIHVGGSPDAIAIVATPS